MMSLVAVMHGCHYYDEIRQVLRIGTELLANRLEMLVRCGLLEKLEDRFDARRYYYRLGSSAEDLLGYVLTLSRWGERYLLKGISTVRPRHLCCGGPVASLVVCAHCREPFKFGDVTSPVGAEA